MTPPPADDPRASHAGQDDAPALAARTVITRRDGATPASSWYALGVILVLSAYAVMDRQIFILLNEPVRTELGLSDTQMGLMQGLGLALLGIATTYPISWLADRFDRRFVIAGCVAVWSLALVLCGLSPSFPWLLIGTSVVGAGEYGLTAPLLALLPDLFSASRLQVANSIFVIGTRFGMSLGVLLAGYLVALAGLLRAYAPAGAASLSDWRAAFITTTLFMPVALLLIFLMPRRASGLSRARAGKAAPMQPLGPFLRRYARPQLSVLIASCAAGAGYACIEVWLPVAAARYFGQAPQQGGQWLASIGLSSAIGGFVLGTPVVRWLQARLGTRTSLVALVWLLFASVPLSIWMGFATSARMLYGVLAVQSVLIVTVNMVLPTMLQMMSPQHVRARLLALFFITQAIASAFSPLSVGVMSDALGGAARPLLTAMMLVSVAMLSLAGAIFWMTIRPYARMVAQVMQEDALEAGAAGA